MCFIRTSTPKIQTVKQEPVQRHYADSTTTKNARETTKGIVNENIKTSAYGLEEIAPTKKKTLLGE